LDFDNIRSPLPNTNSRDGWERVWGEGIPKISDSVRKMLLDWKEKEEYNKIVLFFMGTCDFSQDRSEYLLRELFRGWI